MATIIDDPDYWSGRAQQVRAQAKDIHDVDSRHELLQIASGYERIAQHAQARSAAKRMDTHAELRSVG
jgi:hypothetical protein